MSDVDTYQELPSYKGSFVNHSKVVLYGCTLVRDRLTSSYLSFNMYGHPGGCGTMIISQIDFMNRTKGSTDIVINKFKDFVKRSSLNESNFISKIGSFQATLGDAHIKVKGDYLKNLGFKVVASYANHQHGGNYKQHLLLLTTTNTGKII